MDAYHKSLTVYCISHNLPNLAPTVLYLLLPTIPPWLRVDYFLLTPLPRSLFRGDSSHCSLMCDFSSSSAAFLHSPMDVKKRETSQLD